MRIAFCAAEVAPFAKTGGLADVAGALPLALGQLAQEVVVLMPKYRGIRQKTTQLSRKVRIVFVENQKFFDRAGIYGHIQGDYVDNQERFTFFCEESFRLLKKMNFKPDILHTHDWHTGPMNRLLAEKREHDVFFQNTKSVFTIHNLAYQGNFKNTNFMREGLQYGDFLTTVSPTYAKEIQSEALGCGMQDLLRKRKKELVGILNGIQTRGMSKKRSKAKLQRLCFGKDDKKPPVMGMVTRLAEQKGFDILLPAFDDLMKRGVQFVILGTGDKQIEAFFKDMQKKYPKQCRAYLEFSAMKAAHIYAGCDFFLMPSRFEPCGLGQMISFFHGAIPIAREIGGLADTVVDADLNAAKGNGFLFKGYTSKAMLAAVDRALALYQNNKMIQAIRKNGQSLDYSWKKSASTYVALYRELVDKSAL